MSSVEIGFEKLHLKCGVLGLAPAITIVEFTFAKFTFCHVGCSLRRNIHLIRHLSGLYGGRIHWPC